MKVKTTFEEAVQRQAAQVIECSISRLRTETRRRRWWLSLWEAGYSSGLRDAHEEAQAVLDTFGIGHPAKTDGAA